MRVDRCFRNCGHLVVMPAAVRILVKGFWLVDVGWLSYIALYRAFLHLSRNWIHTFLCLLRGPLLMPGRLHLLPSREWKPGWVPWWLMSRCPVFWRTRIPSSLTFVNLGAAIPSHLCLRLAMVVFNCCLCRSGVSGTFLTFGPSLPLFFFLLISLFHS